MPIRNDLEQVDADPAEEAPSDQFRLGQLRQEVTMNYSRRRD